jgi:hypothetical protein
MVNAAFLTYALRSFNSFSMAISTSIGKVLLPIIVVEISKPVSFVYYSSIPKLT